MKHQSDSQRHTKKSRKETGKPQKLNVRLLRRIQRHILEEPRRFEMGAAVIRASSNREWAELSEIMAKDASKSRPPCGTAACIAGWANILTGANWFTETDRGRAAEVLGVENTLSWTSHPLFYAASWPAPFANRYERAKTPKTRAKIACARIDHLILTGE